MSHPDDNQNLICNTEKDKKTKLHERSAGTCMHTCIRLFMTLALHY